MSPSMLLRMRSAAKSSKALGWMNSANGSMKEGLESIFLQNLLVV